MATNVTLASVYARARAHLNDSAGAFWTDALLLEHAKEAYDWIFDHISRVEDVSFVKVANDAYSADADTLTNIPTDLYLPEKLEFRKNTSEEWSEVNRVDSLRSRETEKPDRVVEWEWRGRTVFVNKASEAGLWRLRYLALLPVLTSGTSQLLMDNMVGAMGAYTAKQAFESRGMAGQAAAKLASAETHLNLVMSHLVKNQQEVPRRGVAFSRGRR